MSRLAHIFPDWNSIEQLKVIDQPCIQNKQVLLNTNQGLLTIQCFKQGIRFRIGQGSAFDYGMLIDLPDVLTPVCELVDDQIFISAGDFRLEIATTPFAFALHRAGRCIQKTPNDGHFVRQYRLPPFAKCDQGWLFSLDLKPREPIYGLGEKWSGLNKRGQFLRSYNVDALGVNAEVSYKNAPFCWSPEGWGCFVHTPAPVTHSVGHAPWSNRAYSLLVEDSGFDMFLLTGDNGQQIIDSYTNMTGKAPVPPDWSLGVILSKAYYKDVDELLATAKAVRENKMPCDVITLDGRAWQDTDSRFAFEWDPKRFDDPKAVLDVLKSMDFKICIWEYPLVSVKNPLFDEMARKGWLLKDKRTGEAYRYHWDMSAFAEVLTPLPESGIVDFTHPDAYVFWRDCHKDLFDIGVDMIKADFGEQVEDDNMLAHNGDSGDRLHNVYALLYNRCVYEAAQMYSKNGPFLFSRSAWTGSQRYPSQWGGDPQADWGGLAGSIMGALSWGMSGAPYYATDVGGFYKDTRDAELFVRWSQVAVFSAHMRLHGIGQREPWSYGAEAASAVNEALTMRYQLIPYLKQCMQQAHATGLPVMRAMPLAFPDQPPSWAFEYQFMFGDDILVAPCVQPGGQVQIYFPEGSNWRRFPAGEVVSGGQYVSATFELNQFPVYVREGAALELAPMVEHTGQLTGKEHLELW